MTNTVKSILPRIGGKARIAHKIIGHLVKRDFRIYVEPFFGSGAVYFKLFYDGYFERLKQSPNKYKYPRIILNDADRWVTELFKYCRDNPQELAEMVALTPFARDEHTEAVRAIAAGYTDKLELIRQYLIAHHQGFASDYETWASCEKRTNGSLDKLSRWIKLPDRIQAMTLALKDAYIENSDFEAVIKHWDDPSACIYCDPPYFNVEHYYTENFGIEDHYRLAKTLNNCQGHVVVSYYPDDRINELYPANKWDRLSFHRRTSLTTKDQIRPQRTELLLVKRWDDSAVVAANGQISLL